MSTPQPREEMLRDLEAKGVLRPIQTFGGEPEAPGLDPNDPRVKRIAEAFSYATPMADEIRAKREAERDARMMHYRDIVDAAHQHHQALSAVYALAMPYSVTDKNGNDPGFEFLNRGDFVALLDLLMSPLNAALNASEGEARHE